MAKLGRGQDKQAFIDMISMRTNLAMDAVYAAFSPVPKPDHINGCPCCTSVAQLCQLLAAPLRELNADRLAEYGRKAMTTIGSVDDFRYFLPRLLELSLQDEYWLLDREILLSKLHYGAWHDWPETERKAVLDLFDAAFEDAISDAMLPDFSGDANDIDTWLCAFALAHLPLTRYFERLMTADAVKALCEFHFWNGTSLAKGKLTNPFWKERELEATRVISWLNSDAVQEKLVMHRF